MLHRLLFALALAASLACAASQTDSISYRPEIHGTVRGRFEASTEHSDYRFQVRNARLSVDGKIAPIADYFVQMDFCDRGKIKILDAWARLWATPEWGFQAGQFRMPFGVDPFRAPHTYIFANRSFIGKQMCNFRAVGAKAMWHPRAIPFTLEAGAFNPGTIDDHTPWHNTLTYAAKATYRLDGLTFATGFQSIKPGPVRANLIDAALTWKHDRWLIEGEYMHKHYVNDAHRAAHAYNLFADYRMPLRTSFFNRLSFQGRFDGLTAHSSATVTDEAGHIVTDHPARNRVTLGSTISYIRSASMYLDLRVNYEKYFYHSGVRPSAEDGDKAVVELVLRF